MYANETIFPCTLSCWISNAEYAISIQCKSLFPCLISSKEIFFLSYLCKLQLFITFFLAFELNNLIPLKKKFLQRCYFWMILDILKTNMSKWKKANVQDATENLVPRVVLKDMKGNKNVQGRPKYICFVMNLYYYLFELEQTIWLWNHTSPHKSLQYKRITLIRLNHFFAF